MAIILTLPLYMQKYMCLDDRVITLYVNPNNNMDYVIYEDETETYMSVDDSYSFDGNHTIIHNPPSMEVGVKRKRVEDGGHGTTVPADVPPFKAIRSDNESQMSIITFVKYFMSSSFEERLSESDVYTIYEVLKGFVIDQKVLDVVSAALEFMYTKTLANTMRRNCDRRNKKFKRRLQFLLSSICKREYSTKDVDFKQR